MGETKHTRTFRSKKLHPEHVKLLNEAIRKNVKGGDHNVKITYRKESGEVSERRIKPLGVKQKDLLLAHCHERNAVRSFKIGRISKMEKSAFWDGFEKRAVSSDLIRRAISSAETKLLRDYHGATPLPKKVSSKIWKQKERLKRALTRKEIQELERSFNPMKDRVGRRE